MLVLGNLILLHALSKYVISTISLPILRISEKKIL